MINNGALKFCIIWRLLASATAGHLSPKRDTGHLVTAHLHTASPFACDGLICMRRATRVRFELRRQSNARHATKRNFVLARAKKKNKTKKFRKKGRVPWISRRSGYVRRRKRKKRKKMKRPGGRGRARQQPIEKFAYQSRADEESEVGQGVVGGGALKMVLICIASKSPNGSAD